MSSITIKENWDPRFAVIAQHLRELWAEESYRSVEEKLGVPRGWAYDLVHGRKKLALDLAVNICKVWKCSLSWLVDLEDQSDAIPIVGVAAAGTSLDSATLEFTNLQGADHIRFTGCEAMVVSGESMLPLADHGQKVIVGPVANFRDNTPAFVRLKDGRRMIKRVTRTEDGRAFILSSLNVSDTKNPPLVVRRNTVVDLREVVGVDLRKVPAAPVKDRRARKTAPAGRHLKRRVLLIARSELAEELRDVLLETGTVGQVELFAASPHDLKARLEGNPPFDGLVLDGFLPGNLPTVVLEYAAQRKEPMPIGLVCEISEVADIYGQRYQVPFAFEALPLGAAEAERLIDTMFGEAED